MVFRDFKCHFGFGWRLLWPVGLAMTVITVMGCSFVAWAEPVLTIEEAVREALANNPDLKAHAAEVEAARARVGQARSLEEPMAGIEFDTVPIDTLRVRQGMSTNYSISQKIPFPTKIFSEGRVAKYSYRAEQNAYQAERLNLIVETEHAYHNLYRLEQLLAINRELEDLFLQMTASEEARYSTSKDENTAAQDFLKARVELDRVRAEGAMLEAEVEGARAMLNILRNQKPEAPIVLAGLPADHNSTPSYANLEKTLLEKHPALKMAEYEVMAAKSDVTLRRQQWWLPDFQAKFTYLDRPGQIDAWRGEAMVSIPFVWGKNRKMVSEAKSMHKTAAYQLTQTKNERLAELRHSFAFWESAKRKQELYQKQVLPHAKLALESSQAAFAIGAVDFLMLIDSARQWKEAKVAGLKALVEVHVALTHLKWAAGEEIL